MYYNCSLFYSAHWLLRAFIEPLGGGSLYNIIWLDLERRPSQIFNAFDNMMLCFIMYDIVTIYGWLQTGYGLVNGFIDHLCTPLRTTSNCSAIANLHTLQITTVPSKIFQPAVSLPSNESICHNITGLCLKYSIIWYTLRGIFETERDGL
jgi:hypothetical protein